MTVHLPIPVIYTVMPSNNYIPGIFQGQGRIFTSRSGSQLDPYCSLGPASYTSSSASLAFATLGGAASTVVVGSSLEFLNPFAWLCTRSSLNVFGSSRGFAECLRLISSPLRVASLNAFAYRLFAWLRLFARPVIPAWLLRRSGLQSMAEGGVPNIG